MSQSSLPHTIAGFSIAIVGPGRLGISLALALTGAGATLSGFFGPDASDTARAHRLLGVAPAASLEELAAGEANVFFVTVPDSVIPTAADCLALALERSGHLRPDESPVFVLHTSGVTSVSALDACRRVGAVTVAFHPLQTFSDPVTGAKRLRDSAIAVASNDPLGWEAGTMLAAAVGGRPFLLDERHRPLYHAAACIASNYVVALAYLAERLFTRAGIPEDAALDAFLPLIFGAVENMRAQGTVAALTGPLSRGDVGTIMSHLAAFSDTAPETLLPYAALGLVTLEIIRERGELPETTIASLEELLSSDTYFSPTTPLPPTRSAHS